MATLVRSILVISLYLCCLAHAHAEKLKRRDVLIRFGGSLGGGVVDWVGKDANGGSLPGEEWVAKPGFSAGLLATLNLSRLLSLDIEPIQLALQPEVLYATKGTGIEDSGRARGAFSLSYLQTGLLLRIDYSTAEKAVPYLLLGPELSFLRRGEIENSAGDTIDIKDDFKSTDLGLILGLGAMYSLPPYGAFGLELRGDLGLVSIDGQGDGDEIRNAALSLLLVYLY